MKTFICDRCGETLIPTPIRWLTLICLTGGIVGSEPTK